MDNNDINLEKFTSILDLNKEQFKTRSQSLLDFNKKGFPSKKNEEWRFIDLNSLLLKNSSKLELISKTVMSNADKLNKMEETVDKIEERVYELK